MLNKIILQGRMVDAATMKTTANGTSCATFTVACERNRKGANGTKETDFISCVAWRHTAEFIEKYFHKADGIIVVGSLSVRSYTAKDGTNRKFTEVQVDDAYFNISPKNGSNFTEDNSDDKNPFVDESGDDDFPF